MNTNRRVFKYRSGDQETLNRDLESLRDDYFFAALRRTLNDPFEGRFDRSVLDQQFEALRQLSRVGSAGLHVSLSSVTQAVEEVFSFVDKSGIYSLSQSAENELLWSHYGGSHHGFCIEFDLAKLIEFDVNEHHCLEVLYSSISPSFSISDLLGADGLALAMQKMLGTKSNPWSYESEVRVVTTTSGRYPYDYRAVKAIHFGLRCPELTRTEVMRTLAGRGVKYMQVSSLGASYALGAVEIPDPFHGEPKYKISLANIADHAIQTDYLKPEQKQYAAYLSKAAEIVRREPYCSEIELVEFSGSKSKPDAPVIFVQYQRAPNKWVNHYLTLPEIDEQYARLDT